MKAFPRLIYVEALPDYQLALRYSDGVAGTLGLKALIFAEDAGVFASLRDAGVFQQVFLDQEIHCPAWPTGVDISPDQAYLDVIGISYESWSAAEYAHVK